MTEASINMHTCPIHHPKRVLASPAPTAHPVTRHPPARQLQTPQAPPAPPAAAAAAPAFFLRGIVIALATKIGRAHV